MVRPDGSVERLHRVVLVHELHRLPPVPAGGSRAHPHLFGEHRGVVWSGTVHRGRRLHHNLVQRPRLLGRREELKGADDVDLLHDPPPADPGGRGDDVQVDEGVRLGCLEHFDDQRVPDVGSDEFGSLQVHLRLFDVDAHDRFDLVVPFQPLGELGREVTRDSGDQDALAHPGEPTPTAWMATGSPDASPSASAALPRFSTTVSRPPESTMSPNSPSVTSPKVAARRTAAASPRVTASRRVAPARPACSRSPKPAESWTLPNLSTPKTSASMRPVSTPGTGGCTSTREAGSTSGPSSERVAPSARCAAAGAKMSRPWKVAETGSRITLGSVISTPLATPPRSAQARESNPLSGPTRS